MRLCCCRTAVLTLIGISLAAGTCLAAESYAIVRITDMLKKDTYEVMTSADFKELLKTIQVETKFYTQAEAAAAKAWKEDDLNKHTPFPSARLAPRKAELKQQFPKKEDAQTKLQQIEERESKKEDRDTQMRMEMSKKNPQQGKAADEREKVEAEKTHNAERAQELLQEKLKELIEKGTEKAAGKEPGAATPAETAPAPAAKPPEKKTP